MRKADEMNLYVSCWNKARINEMLFILLARDEAAPIVIRAWIAERIRLGLNKPSDSEVVEAEICADIMDRERAREQQYPT